VVPTDPWATRFNYFLGSDPARWRSGVRTYGAVIWRGLYPGISLTLREVHGEPTLVVDAAPGADLTDLRLRVRGAKALRASPDGVVAETIIGSVSLPAVVQGDGPMVANAHGLDLSFTGRQSPAGSTSRPSSSAATAGGGLEYGTFLGASQDDHAADLVVGSDGSRYVAGWTFSPSFPTTPGAFDTTYDDDVGFGGDVYVSKIHPTGSTLVYSTFLGGGSTDTAASLAVGPDGSAYVGGHTASPDFPTTPGAFDTTYDGGDAFLTKLEPDGAALVYSTLLGGVSGRDSIEALVLAPDETVYAAGQTRSPDFPTTPGAYDQTISSTDAFVTHLNATGSDLVFSTALGGTHTDIGYGLTLSVDGAAFVTGFAQSRNFPTTPGAFDQTFNGGNDDLFVSELNPAGSALVFSTYLGGSDNDTGTAIKIDSEGNVYVVGHTGSPNYPTTPGAYDPTINSYILTDAFATKLAVDGSMLMYSTFLGGNDSEVWPDLSVDPEGTMTVAGTTLSPNFPTTPGAFDRTLGGSGDVFVSRFNPTGGILLYSSLLGGNSHVYEQGAVLARAGPGAISVSGFTASPDFPTTADAYDAAFNGGFDAFLVTLRVAPTMHVARIVPRYRAFGSGYVVGAGVRILVADGSPVEGASVTVEIAYPDGSEVVVSRPTGPQGNAIVARQASESGTYTFTVLDVTRTGLAYDPAQNAETSDSVTIP
jgi:hypothetical protein